MPISKDKRTKEEILKLLDRAMEQEDRLAEKIASLETALAECRKKAENPRHEFTEEALSSSKVSFRIDYYRTAEKGPLKGIIEHLSTREKKAFHGDGFSEMEQFMRPALSMKQAPARNAASTAKRAASAFRQQTIEESPALQMPAQPPEVEITEVSPLVRKILPHLFTPSPKEGILVAVDETPTTPVGGSAQPFRIVREGRIQSERALRAGQPFQVDIPLEGLDEFIDKPCMVSLSAEALEKMPGKNVLVSERCTPTEDSLRAPGTPLSLKSGVYRIIVVLALTTLPQKIYYQESRLVVVQ